MTNTLSMAFGKLRTADRLMLAAAITGLAVMGYYGMLGTQFWETRGQNIEIQDRIAALANVPASDADAVAELEAEAAEIETVLADELDRLTIDHTDDIVAMVVAHGDAVGVQVANISVRPGDGATVDGLTFTALVVATRIVGDIGAIQDFIEGVAIRSPGLTVRSVVINGLPDTPWAQIELDFLYDPIKAGA